MCRVLLLCNFYIKYCKIVLIKLAIATLNRFMLLSWPLNLLIKCYQWILELKRDYCQLVEKS